MNATVLLLTAWMASADAAPACQPACAPVIIYCKDCCEREGLLSRLRDGFHRSRCDDSCAPACPTIFVPYQPSCERPSLLRRLCDRFRHSDCDDSCGTVGYSPAPAPVAAKADAHPVPRGAELIPAPKPASAVPVKTFPPAFKPPPSKLKSPLKAEPLPAPKPASSVTPAALDVSKYSPY
jgi:hypothetical protein